MTWIDTSDSLKGCVLEIGLQYLKELRELHNDYPLTQDKIEIESEILSGHQLRLLIYTILLLVTLKN